MTISSGAIPKQSSAVTPIYSHNFLASVFWLILAFIGSSGLFIVLGMEFLGLIFLIVYVGAICIIFLFVIMMIPGGSFVGASGAKGAHFIFNWGSSPQSSKSGPSTTFGRAQYKATFGGPAPSAPNDKTGAGAYSAAPSNTAIGVLIGAILGAELSAAVPESFLNNSKTGSFRSPPTIQLGVESILESDQQKNISPGFQNWVNMRGAVGAPEESLGRLWRPFGEPDGAPLAPHSFFTLNGSGGSNLEAIGSVLYINYYYVFILVSFILLVAMIGAIVLGLQSSNRN
uniref:NADH-ubiquinone oxidoreductase chain 6 n=1 Tax=Placozoa sp. H17 HM-2017 TaxID=2017600 RepID=A0A7I6N492_9METZ|nr:NADH dehydrogenase subunit 6 [Placozoa sp. H17 HM-2017]